MWHRQGVAVRRRRFIQLRTEPPRAPEGFILPCIPTFAHVLPEGPLWVYEIKHDGYRFLCRRDGERVAVYSRWGVNWTAHVPTIAETFSALPARSLTIDGDGVACGPDGIPDFERLRTAVARKGARGPFLYAFDLLELEGRDLGWEPWETRRTLLRDLLRGAGDGIRLSDYMDGADGTIVFRHAAWGWKASSPSDEIGRIDPVDRL